MTDAAGCISLVEETLKNTLGDSDTFRTWVGASGDDAQEQARNRIHPDALPRPDEGEYTLAALQRERPFALISTGDFGGEHDSSGSSFDYTHDGVLQLRLIQDVRAAIANDPEKIGREFYNTVGQIMDDLEALAGTGGYLAIERWKMPVHYDRSDTDEVDTIGDVVAVEIFIEHSGI